MAQRAATFDEHITVPEQQFLQRLRKGTLLDSLAATRNVLSMTLSSREFEAFCSIYVVNRFSPLTNRTTGE